MLACCLTVRHFSGRSQPGNKTCFTPRWRSVKHSPQLWYFFLGQGLLYGQQPQSQVKFHSYSLHISLQQCKFRNCNFTLLLFSFSAEQWLAHRNAGCCHVLNAWTTHLTDSSLRHCQRCNLFVSGSIYSCSCCAARTEVDFRFLSSVDSSLLNSESLSIDTQWQESAANAQSVPQGEAVTWSKSNRALQPSASSA